MSVAAGIPDFRSPKTGHDSEPLRKPGADPHILSQVYMLILSRLVCLTLKVSAGTRSPVDVLKQHRLSCVPALFLPQ
jgi:hypothetical protein